MSNRYQSNIRTFFARNMIWNKLVVPPVPHIMAAPATLAVRSLDSFYQPFRANNGTSGTEWNIDGNLFIRRVGIFSNFADGLVFLSADIRLSVSIRVAVFSITSKTGTMTFLQGSNAVTGTNFNAINPFYVSDDANIYLGNTYQFTKTSDTTGYLSDYAFKTVNVPNIYDVGYSNLKDITIRSIPVLNQFFDTEIFQPVNTIGMSSTVNFVGVIGYDGGSPMLFDTNTIDTGLNGTPVNFDIGVEVELTPN